MIRNQFTLLTLLLTASLLGQGPIGGFPTPKGEIAAALTYSAETYGTYFDQDGSEEARDITTTSYSLFFEAGLNEQLALIGTLPYMQVNDDEATLQDGSLWLKYMNLDNRRGRAYDRVFTAVGMSFPLGNYATEGVTALGQKATVFQARLAYQYQHDSGFFLHAQSGIDFQVAPESRSSWPVLLRGGYGSSFLYFEAWLEFVKALDAGTSVNNAVAGTGSSWRRVGGTFYVPVLRWVGLTLGGAWVLDGEQIGKSGRLNLGVVCKLRP